eukprot:g2687.t1
MLRYGGSRGIRIASSVTARCPVRFGSSAKKKKKKGDSGASEAGSASREDQKQLLELLDPVNAVPVPPMTPEQREIFKEYTRGKQRRHNREFSMLTRRNALMRKAIEALPSELQDEAKKVDTTPFPFYPDETDTPPIPGHVHPEHRLF